jgi:hypothetical protein
VYDRSLRLVVEEALRCVVAPEPFASDADADAEIEMLQAHVLKDHPWDISGHIVLAAAPGDYGKPRPLPAVQAAKHIRADRPEPILVCPFISHQETLPYRVPVALPYGDVGLDRYASSTPCPNRKGTRP